MVEDLIYDVGMNNGDDTAYYLHKGYRVVAIEANPILADRARTRFQAEIAAGRLTILAVGVGAEDGVATFWVNDEKDDWSSFVKEIGCRNGLPCHSVDVPCRQLADIFKEYGVPLYLKIDIECYDIHCLEDIDPQNPPRYVSVEAHNLDYLFVLASLGYNAFKCTNQLMHNVQPGDNADWAGTGPKAHLRRIYHQPQINRALRSSGIDRLLRGLHQRARQVRQPVTVPQETNAGQTSGPETNGAEPHPAEIGGLQASGVWVFPNGSSGPFGEDIPEPWQTLEEVAYKWLSFALGHYDNISPNVARNGWYDYHATILENPPVKPDVSEH